MTRRRTGLVILVLLVIVLSIVGVILLVVAYNNSEHKMTHDIVRDIGIAFLISALVTIAYETYARTRFDLEKIESLLDTVYGSGVPAAVWESIKETLLKRELIRRNTAVHMRVRRDAAYGEDNLVLEIDLAYDLANLLSKSKRYEIIHGLDEHIVAPPDLPRFLEASIDNRSNAIEAIDPWSAADGSMRVQSGRLHMNVDLPASQESVAMPLRIVRREVRNCPGSYYLIMTEVTDAIRIYLDEVPLDVKVTLGIRPSENIVDLTAKHLEIINEPLLPGHALEFKFTVHQLAAPQIPNLEA